MGRSAKTHKRIHKKVSQPQSSKQQLLTPKASSTPAEQANAQAKRKDKLKGKSRTMTQSKKVGETGTVGSVLGDVDYVTLMMGGRRKAEDEASKMVTED